MQWRRRVFGAATAAAILCAACSPVNEVSPPAPEPAVLPSDLVDSYADELARLGDLDRLTLMDSDGRVREAVDGVTGRTVRFRTRAQAGARLRFAYAVLDRDWDFAAGRVVFSVLARDADGKVTTLFTAAYPKPVSSEDFWQVAEAPLDDFGDAIVDLLFQVEINSEDADLTPYEGRPVWSNMRVIRPEDQATSRPDIFWITLDTIRADHLGCYGYPKPTSPAIDALAAGGVLFEKAFSHSPWTRPSVASMLYSDFPHRIDADMEFTEPDTFSVSDPLRPSLQRALREAGYITRAITSQPNIAYSHGFAWGFDEYTQLHSDDFAQATFTGWLPPREGRRPVFVYMHLLGAHQPYAVVKGVTDTFLPAAEAARVFGRYGNIFDIQRVPPKGRDLEGVIGLYDGEVRAADNAVAEILRVIRERASPDALIVVTSDHGEEFGEHGGWDHGHSYYDELLHVPLIIAREGLAARRDSRLVGLSDVAPTLLAAAGVPKPDRFVGRDLLADGGFVDWPVLAENNMYEKPMTALRTESAKYVYRLRPGRQDLIFDLASDPGEQRNLAEDPARVAQARQVRDVFFGGGRPLTRDTEWWLRLSGSSEHTWRLNYESDEPIQPRLLTRRDGPVNWTENGDQRSGALDLTTKPGEAFLVAMPLTGTNRRLALRIEVDGRPIADGELAGPRSVPPAELLADLAAPDARRAGVDRVAAPPADSRETLVFLSGNPLTRTATTPDHEDERERLKSLGYLQ